MDKEILPQIGSTKFWNLYDEFCHPDHLTRFVTDESSPLSTKMCMLMEEAHTTGTIHQISRPDRKWDRHMAWLALRAGRIFDTEGYLAMSMRPGDVIVVARQWDRDTPITHIPIREHVSGYLLSGHWKEMVGLFMPLYEKETILKCIELRMTKNTKEAMERAQEESRIWGWY
ncbi:MAG: hypothetical protein HGB03_00290 [Candidatus Yonathbacteria bacterium]|nr:hypothetical protein [Candidatus Yonathbacteria bacterium]NTW48117.1 hypothetical protein [Candidatus Yonathbacteria bacterium]